MESGARPELNAQRYAVCGVTPRISEDSHWTARSGKASEANAASPETLVRALRMKGYLNLWKVRKFAFRVGNNEKY